MRFLLNRSYKPRKMRAMKQLVDLLVYPEREFVSPLLREEPELAARPKTGNLERHVD